MAEINETEDLDLKYEKMYSEDRGLEYDEEISIAETDDDDEIEEQPFNPEKIRVEQQMLSVKYMLELMSEGLIELNPGYQRSKVWKDNKKKSCNYSGHPTQK